MNLNRLLKAELPSASSGGGTDSRASDLGTGSASPRRAGHGTTTGTAPSWLERYLAVRGISEQLVAPLSPEDCMIQSMPEASPARWHLAHTTWFFETFLLKPHAEYREFNPQFNYLFNSYYNAIGRQYPRPQRGVISRPGFQQIMDYRRHVDDAMRSLLADDLGLPVERMAQGNSDCGSPANERAAMLQLLRVGLNHEQQHQELMLTDIKHGFSCNPIFPVYSEATLACGAVADATTGQADDSSADWLEIPEGVYAVGANNHAGGAFCFDNESPRHRVFVEPAELSAGLVTCGEYLEFIEDGGYEKPEFWLSAGWSLVEQQQWKAPQYWFLIDGQWMEFTLAGLVPLQLEWPVNHLSFVEADAFARWRGCRLPTEFEWEAAWELHFGCRPAGVDDPLLDNLLRDGTAVHATHSPTAWLGGLWQWTSSSYGPYPGYAPPVGAIGEYNGKFMCNQYVLRGGSVATQSTHIRGTYRNFFPIDARWQFSGLRLARSV